MFFQILNTKFYDILKSFSKLELTHKSYFGQISVFGG